MEFKGVSNNKVKMSANFENLKVDTKLTYNAYSGVLLLPRLALLAATTIDVTIEYGEVVIQSSLQSMLVKYIENYSNSVCFASTSAITYDTTMTDNHCNYTLASRESDTNFPIYDDTKSQYLPYCSGAVKFTGSPTATITLTIKYGSIYVNYVDNTNKLPDDPANYKVVSSYPYSSQVLGLNQDLKVKIADI